jgi:hypothetical protein
MQLAAVQYLAGVLGWSVTLVHGGWGCAAKGVNAAAGITYEELSDSCLHATAVAAPG